MRISRFLAVLFTAVFSTVLFSCSTDEEQSSKGKVDTTSITVKKGELAASIRLTTSVAWSAYTSDVNPDEHPAAAFEPVDWMMLHDSRGEAGENFINIELEPNYTSASRTGYVVILCQDERIVVQVVQENEEESAQLNHLLTIFQNGVVQNVDNNIFSIENGRVVAIDGEEAHLSFEYSSNKVVASGNGYTYEIQLGDRRFATEIRCSYKDGSVSENAVYKFFYYDDRIVKVEEYREGILYETTEITWNAGDISNIHTVQSSGAYTDAVFEYYDELNQSAFMLYDAQCWVDIDELEMFYYCGFLGHPTRRLVKSVTAVEVDNGEEYEFKSHTTYSFDAYGRPVNVMITETESGEYGGTYINEHSLVWTSLF